jgi:hypothetical protein
MGYEERIDWNETIMAKFIHADSMKRRSLIVMHTACGSMPDKIPIQYILPFHSVHSLHQRLIHPTGSKRLKESERSIYLFNLTQRLHQNIHRIAKLTLL